MNKKAVNFALIIYLGMFLYYVWQHFGPPNVLLESHSPVQKGRDFINYWMGGQAAISGDVTWIYDRDIYHEKIYRIFSEQIPQSTIAPYSFSYPPHSLILLAPIGAFPYLPALVLWSLLGMIAAWKAFTPSLGQRLALITVFLPAGMLCLVSGQNGFFTAALLIGGFSLLKKTSVLAGVLFGILTFKPHLGVLLVLALIVSKQWKAIFTAFITTLILLSASMWLYGFESWKVYLYETIPHQKALIDNSIGLFDHMVPSLYKSLINSGLDSPVAMSIQGIIMFGAALLTIWTFTRPRNAKLQLAMLCTLTSIFSPYMVTYDLLILTFAVICWWLTASEKGDLPIGKIFIAACVIIMPILHQSLSMSGFYFLPLASIIFAGIILQDLIHNSDSKSRV